MSKEPIQWTHVERNAERNWNLEYWYSNTIPRWKSSRLPNFNSTYHIHTPLDGDYLRIRISNYHNKEGKIIGALAADEGDFYESVIFQKEYETIEEALQNIMKDVKAYLQYLVHNIP